VITNHGLPAAVVLSMEDLESLEETLEVLNDEPLMADIREALAERISDPPVGYRKMRRCGSCMSGAPVPNRLVGPGRRSVQRFPKRLPPRSSNPARLAADNSAVGCEPLTLGMALLAAATIASLAHMDEDKRVVAVVDHDRGAAHHLPSGPLTRAAARDPQRCPSPAACVICPLGPSEGRRLIQANPATPPHDRYQHPTLPAPSAACECIEALARLAGGRPDREYDPPRPCLVLASAAARLFLLDPGSGG
jgi:hypothetical protein